VIGSAREWRANGGHFCQLDVAQQKHAVDGRDDLRFA